MAYVVAAGVAAAGAVWLATVVGWLIIQVQLGADRAPSPSWPVYTLIGAAVAAVATVPILTMRRFVRLHRIGIVWAGSAVVTGAVGCCRFVPVADDTVTSAVQSGALLLAAAVGWSIRTTTTRDRAGTTGASPTDPGAVWWAGCAGTVPLIGWATVGTAGSAWDTLLAAGTAVAFGLMSAVVLGDRFWEPFATVSRARRIWGGGAAAGVALSMPGSVLGAGGVGLTTMSVLFVTGFVVAAFQGRPRRTGRITAAAVIPVVFAPLAFVDGDEFLPLVFGPEFATWPMTGMALATGAAGLVAVILGPGATRSVRYPAVGAGALVVALAAVVAVHQFLVPGFHGEKLLVVMEQQADLSDLDGGPGSLRREEVWRRLVETADTSQRRLRAELTDAGIDHRPFYLVNAIEVDDAPFRRARLANHPDVDRVLLSPQPRPVPAEPEPESGAALSLRTPQPNIDRLAAPTLWEQGVDGTGITIGIADSGVDGSHPAVADRFRGGDDSWADPVNGTTAPTDPNGHGTHALGLALGADGIGMAPGAQWVGCANLPRNAGNPGDYLACLQFMLAPYPVGGDPFTDGDPQRAPDIVTNSWGCPAVEGCDDDILTGATAALTTAGIFFVAAAGNSGPACGSAATPPASVPEAFVVGAVDADDELAGFSSRGPVSVNGKRFAKPDIVAPGVAVVSALPGGGYGRMSGTSMATPQVAGAVALLWSAMPELRGEVATTAQLLTATADPVSGAELVPLDACGTAADAAGAGVVNVAAAVKAAHATT